MKPWGAGRLDFGGMSGGQEGAVRRGSRREISGGPSTASDARAARAARRLSWNGMRDRYQRAPSNTASDARAARAARRADEWTGAGLMINYSSFFCKDVLVLSVQRAGPSRTPSSHSGLRLPRSGCRSNTRITAPARARTPSCGMRSPRLRRTGNSKTSTMRAHHTGSPRRRLD